MQFARLPRFQRHPSVAPIKLTARDQQIIRLVYRHRFLRSNHIVSLLGGSPQQLLRRLQLLYHHGYLERPRAQIAYYHRGGSRLIAYGLGSKGESLLKHELGDSFHEVSWDKKNRSVRGIFLEHALLVSDVMVTLELTCRENGRVRLLAEDELVPANGTATRQPFKWRVNVNSRTRLGVVPDRVFALEFQNPNGNTERAYFFLEADRGTMPVTRRNLSQTSFLRKLLAYEATWSQAIHTKRFGLHRFRVITVTTSPARVKSLVDACSKLEKGHGLFLFADRLSIENRNLLFDDFWRTGRSGEQCSLLEN